MHYTTRFQRRTFPGACMAIVVGTMLLFAPAARAEDEWQTYRDPELGLEISYPASYFFSQHPAVLEGARGAAADKLGESQVRQLEFVFFVFLYEPGSVEFNPNLNLSVEQLPEALAGLSEEEYLQGTLSTMGRTGIQRLGEGEIPAVIIDGRRFYRIDGAVHAYGEEILTRSYIHYDPETRRGYNLNLADLAADAEEHFPLLEAVVETVRFGVRDED